jgi:hypothetical protein
MAGNKYLNRDATSGQIAEVAATQTSAGGADANKIPALDSTGRLDSSMMPVGITADTKTYNASGALSAGDFVYITSGSLIARASAAVAGNAAMGFVLAASLSGAAATIYFEGRNTALSGLTPGARYYLSDSVAGGLTTAPVTGTGKMHQFLGYAISATELDFEPDDAIILA